MMRSFIIGLLLFVALDYIWINHIGKHIIHQEVGVLLTRYPDILAGSITWLAVVLGLYLFPLQQANGWLFAVVYGALFGMIVYTVYEGTNKALLKGWTWRMAIFDVAWGTLICGVVTLAMYLVR